MASRRQEDPMEPPRSRRIPRGPPSPPPPVRHPPPQPTMANVSTHDVAQNIATYLASKGVPPTEAWLQNFVPTVRVNTPVLANQKTALFRLLATDLTTSVKASASGSLPQNISDPTVKEKRIPGPITVQVLDVEDIGRSRWSQVEAIEAAERGETTKGREVIRVLPEEGNAPADSTQAAGESRSSGPHKLLLQDAKGTKAYAMELKAVGGVGISMSIGSKMVLRDVLVARGVMLLEGRNVELLGGKVDAWDKKWRDERKAMLKEKAGVR